MTSPIECSEACEARQEVRALSIRQPWASLIATGRKTIELRSWRTDYRGPLLILAGSAVWRGQHSWPLDVSRGVTVALVELAECRASSPDDAHAACLLPFGFAWVLRNARPVKTVPAKGRLGLYRPDPELLTAAGIR